MVIKKLLEKVPFFWEFTPAERDLLVEGESFFQNYREGDFLIHEGDSGDDALLILIKGSVSITRNENPDDVLAVLEAGAVIGEMSFLTGQPRATNVIAREEATAFRIGAHEMDALDLRLQLKIKDQLIRILVDRLANVNKNLTRQKQSNHALAEALAKMG